MSVLARLLLMKRKQVPFRVVAADPPWCHDDQLPGERGAGHNYPLLTEAQISAKEFTFAFPQVEDDAALFLWRVSSMQQEALNVVEAWGFDLKTEIVWCKLTKKGKPWFGMGRTVRASHETCLVATRGRMTQHLKSKSIRSTFTAPVPVDASGKYIHSGKPEVFYTEIVQALFPGPYAELFARSKRAGWTSLGNEVRS